MAKDLCGDERCGHQSPPPPPARQRSRVGRPLPSGRQIRGGLHRNTWNCACTQYDSRRAKTLKDWVDGDRFRFILLGDGANKTGLDKRTRAEGLNNVIFVEHACQG